MTGLMYISAQKIGVWDQDLPDLVQDSVIKLMNIEFDGKYPAALAKKIATELAIDRMRMKTRRDRLDKIYRSSPTEYLGGTMTTLDTEPLSRDPSPETKAILHDMVQVALSILTDEQKQAVYLIDVLGYTYQEAANQVGISKQSFHRRHTRARGRIARWRDRCGT